VINGILSLRNYEIIRNYESGIGLNKKPTDADINFVVS